MAYQWELAFTLRHLLYVTRQPVMKDNLSKEQVFPWPPENPHKKMDVTAAGQSNEAQQATGLLCQGKWNQQQPHALISQSATHSIQLSTLVLSLIPATQCETVLPSYPLQQSGSHHSKAPF